MAQNKFSISKATYMIPLLIVFLLITAVITIEVTTNKTAPTSASAANITDDGIYNQLKNIPWTYKYLFGPQDIPLPPSMKDTINPVVKSLYSPSVIKKADGYYMAFGVSLYCNAGGENQIARDSIALAWSKDGSQWAFLRYLIEPDTTTCFASTNQWGDGASFQTNDPYMFIDGNVIRVLYTTAEWKPKVNIYGCGNIGIAAFDSSFNLLFRNDKFLDGGEWCDSQGLSRPSLQRINPSTSELWVDSSYLVKSTPLTAIDRISQTQQVRNRGVIGGDIDTPSLDFTRNLILYNGGLHNIMGITAQSSVSEWTTPWPLTTLSGNSWDNWYHGSPFLFYESGCKFTLYFSGMSREAPGVDFPIGVIAHAKPPQNKLFSFPGCN